jgi:2-oxoisovalerate ferredoxin oxidoreductase beta subunit
MQAANRGERMAVFFVNNTVYGMTGGQMAPTTLVGERTSTSPQGRDPLQAGYPLHMCELIDQLEAPVFIERVSVSDIRHIRKARKAVRKALEIQRDKKGYAFVEILSPCPTNFKQDIAAGIAFVNEQMEKEFPLGNYRDRSETAEGLELPDSDFSIASLEHLLLEDGHGGPEAREDSSFPTLEIKIAGFGGQGVLSMGLMLTRAGCREGRFVSWLPSYGPEQRGGTSNCSVVIAGQAIGAPVVNHPDVLVAMNRPSLQRFADSVKPDGLVLFDRTIDDFELPGHVRSVAVLAMQIAGEAGSEKAANTVMLGVLMAMEALPLPEEAFRYGLQQHFSARPDRLDMNIRVFDHAREWASEHL